MWPGVVEVAASSVLIAHTSLVPAGAGVVGALVRVAPPARGPAATGPAGDDQRVRELRARAASDELRTVQGLLQPRGDTVAARAGSPASRSRTRVLWELAAVCTAASAVVHAVAAPHHAAEHLVLGAFFSVSAVLQFAWVTVALLSPHRRLLWHGVWLNLLLIVLWAVSRTVGLPLLLDGPEPVGVWDLSAKLWELGAMSCCLVLLHPGAAVLAGRAWPSAATGRRIVVAALLVSVVALVALGLSGPPT